MNENNGKEPKDLDKSLASGSEGNKMQTSKSSRVAVVAIVAIAAIAAVASLAWFLWPSKTGKPVPAPRSVSFGESPSQQTATAGDQKLTLTTEQLQRAGLKIETVGERPSSEAVGQMTTGVVQANTYKETPVMSLVGGIVRSVKPELGQSVQRGQTVAIVASNELADLQSRYLTSLATLDEHHRHHARTIKLVEIGAASREELEMANTKLRDAESEVANLRQKLLLLGLSSQRIASLNSTSQISSEVNVPAPSSGTLTSRSVNPGEVVEANKELMRVTDLSSIWVVGQVYEKDLATIRVGSGANITSDAYHGRVFRGRISYVDPKVDSATHTAQVRIELANPRQMFKIGMYVNVAFATLGAGEKTIPVIPKEAVQKIGNHQFVFVAGGSRNEFTLRQVRTGPETGGFLPVLEGVSVGEQIVSEGSFMLRAEWFKLHPNQ
ncbi:MAG: rane fusion protein heavy metal efflux system [Blastocatellia bacterium]|jgi:cobalt-zinc-cadmium efflux system membrane fusion protein|nr:rane fusion protein heavy metal efflux system [Blastocatellia bacterium]